MTHKAMVTDIEMAMNDVLANFGLLEDVSAGTVHALATAAVTAALAQAETQPVACECTKVQQDETCPVGYPSLLCDICDGKGMVPASPVPAKREAGVVADVETIAKAIWSSHELRDWSEADKLDRGFHLKAAQDVVRALSASSTPADGEDTPAPVQHSRVKPLEWEKTVDGYRGTERREQWAAKTPWGRFYIWHYQFPRDEEETGPKFTIGAALTPYQPTDHAYPSLEAAQAAAQAEYEQRVLSALITPPPVSRALPTAPSKEGSTDE